MTALASLAAMARRHVLWSTAVFAEGPDWRLGDPLGEPILLLDARKLWRSIDHVYIRADPFLIVVGDALYLLLEAQRVGEPGCIEAYRSRDLTSFDYLGVVLREPRHLSYPCVWEDGGDIYMIPETAAASEMCLYEFADFPHAPRRVRTLLEGSDYLDTTVFKHASTWYLFTTTWRGLEIHVSDDLERGAIEPHPMNPITDDPRRRQCGGPLLAADGRLYRMAQDGTARYGGNLQAFEITALSRTDYAERAAGLPLFSGDRSWNALGGHHLATASFAGRTVVAVDGQQHDHYHHKLPKLLRKAAWLLRR